MLNLSKQQPKHNNKDCFSKNRPQFNKKGKPADLPFLLYIKLCLLLLFCSKLLNKFILHIGGNKFVRSGRHYERCATACERTERC